MARRAAESPFGRWILGPHPDARSETAFQLWDADGNLRTLRVDRTFLAGPEPGSEGATHRWIVDYKTGAAGTQATEEWQAEQRALYGGQLETYARVVSEGLPVRCGLFYPEIEELLWWIRD